MPTNYRYYTPYDEIPMALRDRYDLDDDYRYIYRNNVIYGVDPRTNLITSIINAILSGAESASPAGGVSNSLRSMLSISAAAWLRLSEASSSCCC